MGVSSSYVCIWTLFLQDRIGYAMITDAEEAGKIQAGKVRWACVKSCSICYRGYMHAL